LEQSVQRFGENVWQNTLVIWRRRVRRFGEDLFGDFWRKCVDDLEKSFGDIGENRSAIFGENVSAIWRNRSAIWRKPFGDNVGDLEKCGRRSYGDFVLEFVME